MKNSLRIVVYCKFCKSESRRPSHMVICFLFLKSQPIFPCNVGQWISEFVLFFTIWMFFGFPFPRRLCSVGRLCDTERLCLCRRARAVCPGLGFRWRLPSPEVWRTCFASSDLWRLCFPGALSTVVSSFCSPGSGWGDSRVRAVQSRLGRWRFPVPRLRPPRLSPSSGRLSGAI